MESLLKACLDDFKSTDNDNIVVLSYPKVYGTSAGPLGGAGGATMTLFRTIILVDRFEQRAIVYLAGPLKKRIYDLKDEEISKIFWRKFQEQNL